MSSASEPIACTLTTAEAADQALEWTDLQGQALSVETVPEGVAMTFPLDLADAVEDLAAREATCCAFLSITTTRRDAEVRLAVTSPNPDGRPVIEALSGVTPG